jgi:aspartate 1-decarboxylase
MMIPFLISKIHRARVTGTDLDYFGSVTIDEEIMKQANLRENQKVEVYDITNGSRLNTYVIPAPPGSRQIVMNGAAAHLVNAGDTIIIAAYALIDERELNTLSSVVVLMNEDNTVNKVLNGKL